MSDDDGNIMTNREAFQIRQGDKVITAIPPTDTPEQRVEALHLAASLNPTSAAELITSADAIRNFIAFGRSPGLTVARDGAPVTSGEAPGGPLPASPDARQG